jgi:PAS domain S-box-containing protein
MGLQLTVCRPRFAYFAKSESRMASTVEKAADSAMVSGGGLPVETEHTIPHKCFCADDIRRAIENDEFVPFFQPLITLRTGQLAGFEILARWRHPELGIVPPNQFISLAEKEGLIGSLTKKLLAKVFFSAKVIPDPLLIAVNISPQQLQDLSLPKQIEDAAAKSRFPLSRLVIEVTESGLVDNLDSAQTIARELKSLGVKIALDDFGTGYSSLLHLQSLPFSELKVDRGFVSTMTASRQSRKIVATVVGLGQSLGLTTIAEGVEKREQAEMLMWLGCDLGQGWLFGSPVSAEDLPAAIAMPRQRVHVGDSQYLWKDISGCTLSSRRLAQLQAIYDGAPVGLAFLDVNLRYVSLNERLARMNGASVEEHLGKTVDKMVPAIFPQFEPYIRQALQGKAIAGVEVTKPVSAEQIARTLLLSYEPAYDEAEEVIGVSVAIVDITERKQTEAALRESEDHYRHMVDLNPQIPWVLDPEGNAMEISPRWERVTGMSREMYLGRGYLSAIHPDDRLRVEEAMDQSIKTGNPMDVECRILAQNGECIWIRSRGAARRDQSGKIIRWYGSVDDISDHKRAEKALLQSEEKYRELFENATYGIFRSRVDGTLLDVNPALVAMLGYSSKDELLSRNLNRDIYENPFDRRWILDSLGPGGRVSGREVNWRRKDGKIIVVRISGGAFGGQDGSFSHFEVIVEDITEQRSLEAQFRQAQKMEAVGLLAGGIAHDFNNLLNVIGGYNEILQMELKEGTIERSYTDKVMQATQQAAALTGQLLAFSRKQMLAPTVLDPNFTIADLGKLLPRLIGEDVELTFNLHKNLHRVKVDASQLEQVLLNLAVNARDAMPTGGKLTIETANVTLDQRYAATHTSADPGEYVMVAVSDTGVGMSKAIQSKIFEPFFTTKEMGKGTGLGLSTVYGVVKQSGGYIWVYSEIGKGTTFKLYFPAVLEAGRDAIYAAPAEAVTSGTETILLVEDEESLRSVAKEYLTAQGYTVLDAANGVAALDVVQAHNGQIDILVTDVIMPKLGGSELVEQIHKMRPNLKVIYVSGYTEDTIGHHGVLDEGVNFIQKPYSLKGLTKRIREVLDVTEKVAA